MISYGDMLDVVEKEEARNAQQTPLVETPEETSKNENKEDSIEDVIDNEEEE